MRVNPYIRPLLTLAIELLNEPPRSPVDLESRWSAHTMPLPTPAGPADLTHVTEYLEQFEEVVAEREDEGRRVALVNALLRRHVDAPHITDHDASGWHLHHRPDSASFGETFAASVTAAAAVFLTERGMQRMGRCSADGCRRAFVDTSAPGRQRYCSPACSNRSAVRRHRSRGRIV